MTCLTGSALRSGGCADYSAKPLAAVALIGAPVSRRRGDGVAPTLRSPCLHARVTNARTNDLHQLTTALAQRFAVIVIEDLNVVGMLANRRLATHQRGRLGELRRQLDYKALTVMAAWSSLTGSIPARKPARTVAR